MKLTEMLMREPCEDPEAGENRHLRTWLMAAMMFAIPWSLGACTDPNGREKLDEYVRNLLAGKDEALPVPKAVGKIDVPFPDHGLIYDYMYEVRGICFRRL